MRVIECNVCGECLSAANDDELIRVAAEHMSAHHPEVAGGSDEVRKLVVEQAYEATDS